MADLEESEIANSDVKGKSSLFFLTWLLRALYCITHTNTMAEILCGVVARFNFILNI